MLEFVNDFIIMPSVPIFLILSGFYYLIMLSAKPLRNPVKMLKIMLKREEDGNTGISPLKSVTMALAGTLGVGNIVGVASAIATGGFGAVFWMWISAFFAMILKYSEIVLSIAHRPKTKGGINKGGAVYYIKDCFCKLNMKKAGTIISIIFALLCILDSLSMGCIVQVNSVSCAFSGTLGVSEYICAFILTLLTMIVIKKGIKGISKVTGYLVPIMSLGYIIMSLWVIMINSSALKDVFSLIIKNAFDFKSSAGGIYGFLMSESLRYGTMRGLLSNEAGCGTAPFAHAASNTKEPAKQGVWGIFEVFVDTIVLCTMTAFVIILNYDKVCIYKNDGIMMTIKAYSYSLGKSAEYFLCIAIFLFAYATLICWAHYGFECVDYISKGRSKIKNIYFILFSTCVFIGSVIAPSEIWTLADFSIGTMTIINVVVLIIMSREVKDLTYKVF